LKGIQTLTQSAAHIFSVITTAVSSGKYYDGASEIASLALSYNKELAQKLWAI
jgi:hypothetical protein